MRWAPTRHAGSCWKWACRWLFAAIWLLGSAVPAEPPVVTRHPLPQRVMAGYPLSLIGGSSDPQASFSWEKDDVLVGGSPVREWRHARADDAGRYCLIARRTDASGSPSTVETASAAAAVDVMVPPLQPGVVDLSWSDAGLSQSPATADVRAIVPLPDGGCLVAGDFASAGGFSAGNICRYLADGSLDPAFAAVGAGFDKKVRTLIPWAGRFVAGGDFTLFHGRAASHLAAFDAQGQRDESFTPATLATNVRALATQTIEGESRLLVGLSAAPYLMRLRPDGSADTAFAAAMSQAGLNGRVNAIVMQADGKILLAGLFSVVSGQPWPFNRIARLLPSGTVDPAFPSGAASGADAEVSTVAVQASGRITLGGRFSSVHGQSRFFLARLLADGSLDPSFQTTPNDVVSAFLPESDGSLIVGGDFTKVAGESLRAVVRLLPSGARDPAWAAQAFNGSVLSLASSTEGKIWVGGVFRQPHECLVRLEGRIYGGPPALIETPRDRRLTAGGTEALEVAVRAGSDAVFVWRQNGSIRAVTVDGELMLPTVSQSDAGLYECRVESPAGSLNVGPFRVAVDTPGPGSRPRQHFTTTQPVPMPNQGQVSALFDLPAIAVDEVRVTVAIQHPDTNDLVIELIGPAGTVVRLFEPDVPVTIRRGRDFRYTVFADAAPRSINEVASPYIGTFSPSGSTPGLSSLRGNQPSGQWKLVVQDLRADSSTGTLAFAALDVFSAVRPDSVPLWAVPVAGAAVASPAAYGTVEIAHWSAPQATLSASFSPDMASWKSVPAAEWLSLRVFDDQTARSVFSPAGARQRFWRLQRTP